VRDPRALWWLSLMARVRQGAPRERIAELAQPAFQAALVETANPPSGDMPVIRVQDARRGYRDDSFEDAVEYSAALTAVFGVLLFALCMNMANLLLARSTGRAGELAVRVALGANRFRLVRHLVLEGIVLAVAGGVGGMFIATWGTNLIAASTLVPGTADVELRLSASVILVTILVTLLVGVCISLIPALRVTGRRSGGKLERSLRRRSTTSGMSRAMLTAQVSLSVILLMGAGFLVQALGASGRGDPGFNTRNLLFFGVKPQTLGHGEGPAAAIVERLLTRLRAVPGVTAVTASGSFLENSWPGRIVRDGLVHRTDMRWLPVRRLFPDLAAAAA
jgi:hypothetical protein